MADTPDTEEGSLARKWITRLDDCDKWQRNYLERCKRITRRYRNERPMADQRVEETRRYAILWSNVQTLGPAIYARTPKPVVTRRYKDSDPVARQASEVLERSLDYMMDCGASWDSKMKLCRDDFLLLARGVAWVRYVPHAAVDEARSVAPESPEAEISDDGPSVTNTAEEPNEIPYAECVWDHVAYDDFLLEPCRSWDETTWVARRVYMDRKALIERFGKKIGRKVPLDWMPPNDSAPDAEKTESMKRAAVYEIWDKDEGKVLWVSKTYTLSVLDMKDDWLKLSGFFPCPQPLFGTLAPDNAIPVPDYVYYQDQAEEIDELTARIGTLTDGLKLIGFYAGETQQDLQTLFMQPSGTLVPIPSMATFSEKGGMKGIIEWMPIDVVATTLKECFEARKQILDDIYQITGIADILRGMSDPRSTATAEQLKGQWGSLRVRDKQREMARFCRDILAIEAEIVSSQFGVETLKKMTNVKMFDTLQQKQLVQQAMQAQLPPPPGVNPADFQEMLRKPTWEEVNALLKDQALRQFRVDVETDSTIEADENEDKQQRIEFVTVMSTFFGQATTMLQTYPAAAPMLAQTALFLARGFRIGREMEDVIEQTFDQLQQTPPRAPPSEAQSGDPMAGQVAALELQQEQVKTQGALQLQQMKMQQAQSEIPIRQAELQLEQQDQQLRLVALNRDPNPQAVATG